jgi:hypothetical protein
MRETHKTADSECEDARQPATHHLLPQNTPSVPIFWMKSHVFTQAGHPNPVTDTLLICTIQQYKTSMLYEIYYSINFSYICIQADAPYRIASIPNPTAYFPIPKASTLGDESVCSGLSI